MYIGMPQTKGERVHLRIETQLKENSLAVAKLQGKTSLTNLVTGLLQEEINRELTTRPELFADALKRVRAEANGIKRSVPIGSPANVAERKYASRKAKEPTTLIKKKGRQR